VLRCQTQQGPEGLPSQTKCGKPGKCPVKLRLLRGGWGGTIRQRLSAPGNLMRWVAMPEAGPIGGSMKLMKNRIAALVLALLLGPVLLCASDLPKPVLPVGTRVSVQLISALSTSADRSGDTFTAKVEDPIFAEGMEVVPAGSTLRGHVTFVKPPGRVKGKAEMRLVADGILLKDGREYMFTGELTNSDESSVKVKGSEGTIQGKGKSAKQAAKESGIGAAIGAGGGAIAAGGTGALYGVGIGAVAGLIHALATHNKDVVLQSGTELAFVLTSPGKESKASQTKGASVPFVCETCR
jgi:hypothetical protein